MKIFVSVGEPSGDVHGALLIEQLRWLQPSVRCVGFGGPRMKAVGFEPIFDLTQHAVMFFAGALFKIWTFIGLLRRAYRYFDSQSVDAVVLIDYPGFNWWIARGARRRGIPVFYYGAPQVWAWAPWRIRKIRRFVSHLLCQQPFEPKWYADRGVVAKYVGHPFFDHVAPPRSGGPPLQPLDATAPRRLLLLPGSRNAEIEANLDCLLSAAGRVQRELPHVAVCVSCYNQAQADGVAQRVESRGLDFAVVAGQTPQQIQNADACIACSGSVSLELLAHRVPTVIYFRIGRLAWWVQKLLIRSKYITLVNLMAADDIARRGWENYDPDRPGAKVVPMPEYFSCHDKSEPIARRVIRWFTDAAEYRANRSELDRLATRFALPGASRRAAVAICSVLEQSSLVHRPAA